MAGDLRGGYLSLNSRVSMRKYLVLLLPLETLPAVPDENAAPSRVVRGGASRPMGAAG